MVSIPTAGLGGGPGLSVVVRAVDAASSVFKRISKNSQSLASALDPNLKQFQNFNSLAFDFNKVARFKDFKGSFLDNQLYLDTTSAIQGSNLAVSKFGKTLSEFSSIPISGITNIGDPANLAALQTSFNSLQRFGDIGAIFSSLTTDMNNYATTIAQTTTNIRQFTSDLQSARKGIRDSENIIKKNKKIINSLNDDITNNLQLNKRQIASRKGSITSLTRQIAAEQISIASNRTLRDDAKTNITLEKKKKIDAKKNLTDQKVTATDNIKNIQKLALAQSQFELSLAKTARRQELFNVAVFAGNESLGIFKELVVSSAAAVAGAAAAYIVVVNAVQEFEKALRTANAITGETLQSMEFLGNETIRLSLTFDKSATEISRGLVTLAQAGLRGAETIQVLEPAIRLSTAAAIDFQEAAEVIIRTSRGFNIALSESAEIADKLTFASVNSLATIDKLGQSLKFATPIFKAAGLSLDELAIASAVLTNRALEAGIAGRGLRQLLAEFVQRSEENSRSFRQLGIEIFSVAEDGTKKMRPLLEIVEEFKTKFPDTGDITALQKLLDAVGIRGATAFASLVVGAEEFGDLMVGIQKSTGITANIAEKQLLSLQSRIQILKNALVAPILEQSFIVGLVPIIEKLTDALKDGGGTTDTYRQIVSGLTRILDKFTDIVINTLIPNFSVLIKAVSAVADVFQVYAKIFESIVPILTAFDGNLLKIFITFSLLGPVIGLVTRGLGSISKIIRVLGGGIIKQNLLLKENTLLSFRNLLASRGIKDAREREFIVTRLSALATSKHTAAVAKDLITRELHSLITADNNSVQLINTLITNKNALATNLSTGAILKHIVVNRIWNGTILLGIKNWILNRAVVLKATLATWLHTTATSKLGEAFKKSLRAIVAYIAKSKLQQLLHLKSAIANRLSTKAYFKRNTAINNATVAMTRNNIIQAKLDVNQIKSTRAINKYSRAISRTGTSLSRLTGVQTTSTLAENQQTKFTDRLNLSFRRLEDRIEKLSVVRAFRNLARSIGRASRNMRLLSPFTRRLSRAVIKLEVGAIAAGGAIRVFSRAIGAKLIVRMSLLSRFTRRASRAISKIILRAIAAGVAITFFSRAVKKASRRVFLLSRFTVKFSRALVRITFAGHTAAIAVNVFVAALGAATPVIIAATPAISVLNAVLIPVAIIAASIAFSLIALTAIIFLTKGDLGGLTDAFGKLFEITFKFIVEGISILIEKLQALVHIVGTFVVPIFTSMFDAIKPVIEQTKILTDLLDGIKEFGAGFLKSVGINLSVDKGIQPAAAVEPNAVPQGRLPETSNITNTNNQTVTININGAKSPKATGDEVAAALQFSGRENVVNA